METNASWQTPSPITLPGELQHLLTGDALAGDDDTIRIVAASAQDWPERTDLRLVTAQAAPALRCSTPFPSMTVGNTRRQEAVSTGCSVSPFGAGRRSLVSISWLASKQRRKKQ